MKHMLSIAAAAFLACGLVGARASAGDCHNSCDTCSSHGKKSFFSGGFFSKKHCGGCDSCATPVVYSQPCDTCDSCGKKWKLPSFKFFGKKGCDTCCDSAPAHHHDNCNDCNSCDPCAKKLSLHKVKLFKDNDCGCDPCAKRLSLPKINFFKRGCGCETSHDSCCNDGVVHGGSHNSGCCGNGTAYHGGTVYHGGSVSGGVIVQPAPTGTHLAPVPGMHPGPVKVVHPAPGPVPVPAGS